MTSSFSGYWVLSVSHVNTVQVNHRSLEHQWETFKIEVLYKCTALPSLDDEYAACFWWMIVCGEREFLSFSGRFYGSLFSMFKSWTEWSEDSLSIIYVFKWRRESYVLSTDEQWVIVHQWIGRFYGVLPETIHLYLFVAQSSAIVKQLTTAII